MDIFLNNEGPHCSLLPFHMITAGNDPSQPPRYRPEGARFHHIFFIEKFFNHSKSQGHKYL